MLQHLAQTRLEECLVCSSCSSFFSLGLVLDGVRQCAYLLRIGTDCKMMLDFATMLQYLAQTRLDCKNRYRLLDHIGLWYHVTIFSTNPIRGMFSILGIHDPKGQSL